MTPAGVPSQPGLAARVSEDDDEIGSVRLTLTLSTSDGGSKVTRYEAQIWYDGKWNEADDLETTPVVESGDDMNVVQLIEELTPSQRYYFATRAHNDSGPSPWSPLTDAIAKSGIPEAPELSLKAADGTSITLTWTVPEGNGSVITSYRLQVSNDGNTAWGQPTMLLDRYHTAADRVHSLRA